MNEFRKRSAAKLPTEFQARILEKLERERDPYPFNAGKAATTRALGEMRWREWCIGGGFREWQITQQGRDALDRFRKAITPKRPKARPVAKPGTCRECGCTEFNACPGGCAWADGTMTICTQCAGVEP